MLRAEIMLPDDLVEQLQDFLSDADRDQPLNLDRIVEDALRLYLSNRSDSHDSSDRFTSPPFWIDALKEVDSSGEPDVSVNHDRYIAERT